MATVLIDPGMLSTRLELEEAVETTDGQGGVTRAWAPVAALWGRLESVSAFSEEVASGLRQRLTHRVTLRFRADVAAGMRLTRRERVFEIRTVRDPDESGRYLVCQCEEIRP
jgi:SPP1 family predicted phage head-tail adaptor